MRSHKVWTIGDAVVDLIPTDSGYYQKCPGGAPANVAVGISRLGGEAGFIGQVGNDPFGRFLKQVLENEQVDSRHLRLSNAHRTSTVLVDLDQHGERTFTFMVRPSADQFLEGHSLPDFQPHQWLLVCSIALANEPVRHTTLTAMRAMHNAGGSVAFDPNLREDVWQKPEEMLDVVRSALPLAHVVKLSEEELAGITGCQGIEAGVAAMEQYRIPLLLITQGKAGVLVVNRGERWTVQGKVVKPLDTTGAGDAFVAGLLAGLTDLDDWPDRDNLEPILLQACACGALATTAKGAMTALPDKAALDSFLTAGSLQDSTVSTTSMTQ